MGESYDLGGIAAYWAVVDYTKETYGLTETQARWYAISVVMRKHAWYVKERAKA